jgi:hypothetical protein
VDRRVPRVARVEVQPRHRELPLGLGARIT